MGGASLWALTIFSLAAILLHLASVGLVLRHERRKPSPDPAIGMPFLCLLRPVCGLDPLDPETLASSFGLDYPDYEIVFCVASARDPVIPLVRSLIAAHPETRARLLIGNDPVSGNPKLNNLVKGWQATSADWIVMSDSNVLLPKDYLRVLLAAGRPALDLCPLRPSGCGPWACGGPWNVRS